MHAFNHSTIQSINEVGKQSADLSHLRVRERSICCMCVQEEYGIQDLLSTQAGFELLFTWMCDQGYHSSIDSHKRNMATFAKINNVG